ncbi:MAG TPA: hypothetical protein VNQ90_00020 [Chthoniobacteraceae bacterium]|nr:hypothetical protein [Chthoniobacteraceae bacterium]
MNIEERLRQERDEQYRRRIEAEEELARVTNKLDGARVSAKTAFEFHRGTIRKWVNENNRLHDQIAKLRLTIERKNAVLKEVERIADDYHPNGASEAELALSEMREALDTALHSIVDGKGEA